MSFVRQVLAEVYAAQTDLAIPAHVLVSLVLYKVVDDDAARPAAYMLSFTAFMQFFRPPVGSPNP